MVRIPDHSREHLDSKWLAITKYDQVYLVNRNAEKSLVGRELICDDQSIKIVIFKQKAKSYFQKSGFLGVI